MKRSGMLNPTCCKIVPVTELHLKHIFQFNSKPRNCINFLLAVVLITPLYDFNLVQSTVSSLIVPRNTK